MTPQGIILGSVDPVVKPIDQYEELKQQSEELQQAYSEMRALQHCLSHELRGPMETIMTYSSLILKGFERLKDTQGMADADIIKDACRHVNQITNALMQLSLASSKNLAYDHVDLSGLAENMMEELLKRDAERKIQFQCKEKLTVLADPSLMTIAMDNLLSNAWKYSRMNTETNIEFGVKEIKGIKTYFVSDNGVGFDMWKAQDLFNPFVRLHGEEFEGTGIGLAIVNRIVKRHRGWVWADSAIGRGTTMHFTLA